MTSPRYRTPLGAAYVADSLEILKGIPDESINLILTSPPFALRRQKDYGNPTADRYIAWFLRFAWEFKRVLRRDGSLVIDIGGSWLKGIPARSIYHFELLVQLVRLSGFHLAEEFFWFNTAKLPTPAEWVTVRRVRVKDAVNCVWWLSVTPNPRASNRRVLKPYSASMLNLLERGYDAGKRPSGHVISSKFGRRNRGAIPPNLLSFANTESNSRYQRMCRMARLPAHPARFPIGLPRFFIQFLTRPGDIVLDPFAGSNVTGEAAEELGRRWLAVDKVGEYVAGSRFRFPPEDLNPYRSKAPTRLIGPSGAPLRTERRAARTR